MTTGTIITGRWRRAAILVASLSLMAYIPSLFGDYLFDDVRFILENPAVHEITPGRIVSFFTDPTSLDQEGQVDIYRPLRTLEFALDWAVSGGAPWFFHLRSMLYHALASLLVLRLFSRLEGRPPGEAGPTALCGALLFALHPVQSECVAFISSRGDILCALLFVLALNAHLDGRRLPAALLLVVAMFAKETAVVFGGAAVIADRYRRDRPSFGWYAVYAGIGAAFTALWFLLVAKGDPESMSQSGNWWGGSWLMNLATMAKGFLYYAQILVLPVDQMVSYHLPARSTLDAATVASIVLVLVIVAGLVLSGRRGRFALLWFAIAILPMSNLVIHLVVPTEERFLLIPSIGVCFFAAGFLVRTRLRFVVLACFFALTFSRTFDWRSGDALFAAAFSVAESPKPLAWRTFDALERAERTGNPADAEAVVEAADAFFRYYRENVQMSPDAGPGRMMVSVADGGNVLLNNAKALLLLGRNEDAFRAAMAAANFAGREEGFRLAEIARSRMR